MGPEERKGESKETPQRKRFQEPERGWLCVLIGRPWNPVDWRDHLEEGRVWL